jgi:hypothetical protein
VFKIMFIPPVYMRRGKPIQAEPFVLAWANNKQDAIKYAIDATDRLSKRPGLVRIIPPQAEDAA